MDNATLNRAALQYGTPLYLFDEDAAEARMRACLDIVGPSVRLCYSIKANPFLIPAMLRCVPLLEVCSPGEPEICAALGVVPEKILFSGVNKTARDIDRALELGVRSFTCESLLHVQLLEKAAGARGLTLPVLLRLTAGSQFGMDEADLRFVLAHRSDTPHLEIEGIHYFSGTQQKRLQGQRKELAMLSELIEDLRRTLSYTVRKVEYGAGLYFPYFEGEACDDTLSPLRELAPDLRLLAGRCELTVEMGRFFASPCGVYLTRVDDIKLNRGANIAILDGGMHHVNYYGGSMGMRVPHIDNLTSDGEARDWMLCGSLCTTADVLVRSAHLPLKTGDILAFRNTGAYSVTEAPGLFLSRDLPRVAALHAQQTRLLRETVPAWHLNCPSC